MGLEVVDQCEGFLFGPHHMGCCGSKPTQDLTDDATAFRSLLEAFRECDPQFSSKIDDLEKLTNVALKLSLSLVANGSPVEFKFPTSLSVLSPMNFPDFVEWCRENGVGLKVGLDLSKGVSCPKVSDARPFPLPHVWGAPTSGMDWNFLRPVTDDEQFAELQHALNLSYKKIESSHREDQEDTRMPDAFKLVSASRNENYRLWANYYMKTHHMGERHERPLQQWDVSTSSAPLSARHKLECRLNEWMLFKGTSEVRAKEVCSKGFQKDLVRAHCLGFFETITIADEDANVDEEGLCCVLLCRVAGGHVRYYDEATRYCRELFEPLVSGENDSLLWDVKYGGNTHKFSWIYDIDQCYPEYILWYRRIHNERLTSKAAFDPRTERYNMFNAAARAAMRS